MTVAASSFDMKVTDPGPLLDAIDIDRVHRILGSKTGEKVLDEPIYTEPGVRGGADIRPALHENGVDGATRTEESLQQQGAQQPPSPSSSSSSSQSLVAGRVYVLPDFVDTDALAPNEALSQINVTDQTLASYCLIHTHPDFRQRVRDGQNIVVAGEGFGCGSSRENAVTALRAAGVQCVIAKSFAFIYGRNQPNLGLLGFELRDPRFWAAVASDKRIEIDLDRSLLRLEVEAGVWEAFPFRLSQMQRRLMDCGGVEKAFSRYGKHLWQRLTAPAPSASASSGANGHGHGNGPGDASGLDVDGNKTATEW